jgi:hypothetical protein
MAIVNANCLGVYYIDGDSTSPLDVQVTTDLTSGNVDDTEGAIDLFVTSADVFLGAGTTDGSSDVTESTFTLAAAATSSTLDVSNSVEETVARDGSCSSTRHIVTSATTWSVSADGLVADGATEDSAIELLDMARAGDYVIVKFAVTGNGTGDVQYVGQGLIESISISGGVDEVATYSASISGYGKLYKYTVA